MLEIKLKSIKGKRAFSRIFENGKHFFEKEGKAVICYRKPGNRNPDAESADEINTFIILNYAVLITKRNSKKAVVRNRIKRLLRESLRQAVKDIGAERVKVIQDVILLWRYAPGHPKLINLNHVIPVVKKLLEKACNDYSKENGV